MNSNQGSPAPEAVNVVPEIDPDEEAFQRFVEATRRPQTLDPGQEAAWIIRYADTEVEDELFYGSDAEKFARRRFEQQRGSWSVSLFQEVARA